MANAGGQEKTESATPKKREDERKKGNISKSQDFTSALTLAFGVGLLAVLAPTILEKLKLLCYTTFTNLNPAKIEINDFVALMAPFAKVTGEIVLPFLISLMLLSFFLVRIQVGALFAADRLKPTAKRFSPQSILQGLKKTFNLFSPKNLFELTKNIFKLIIVGSCGYSVVNSRRHELEILVGADISTGFTVLGSILIQMLITMCAVMIILGFLDKKYQDYEYEKTIKMTKQEVKDEWKNIDGDPKIKQRIRSAQMRMMNQKMMSKVPTADVIVTNPTHFAVAIKYDKLVSPAPIVVAKGVDYLAFKIREIAQNNKVPIVENPPLARSLYKLVPLDSAVPEDLYVAVAEVLAYVYNKNIGGVR